MSAVWWADAFTSPRCPAHCDRRRAGGGVGSAGLNTVGAAVPVLDELRDPERRDHPRRPGVVVQSVRPDGQLRSFRWSGWGSKTAVGRGKARYCDNGCNAYRSATIRLTSRRRLCEAPATNFYLRYRLTGTSLTALLDGTTLRSGPLSFCP